MSDHLPSPSIAQALAGVLTTGDAARELRLSQDRVMRLLNQGALGGVRWGNRWFLTSEDVSAFREQRYGAAQALCMHALQTEGLRLTPKQRRICETLQDGCSMTEAARITGVPRPSLYAHLKLIRRKLEKLTTPPPAQSAHGARFAERPQAQNVAS
jgi:excisionase family DNA binding protein